MIVDVANGKEIATAVHEYANGVIDDNLPGTEIHLEPDWALQDPNDYIDVFKNSIPARWLETSFQKAERHDKKSRDFCKYTFKAFPCLRNA